MALDKISLALLNEFSSQFGIKDLDESQRFEHFAAWIVTYQHYRDSTVMPTEIHTGGNGDPGIDAIAVIVNNNLVTDVDEINDLLDFNDYLDVTFLFVQAERSAHFDGAKIGTFGHGVNDFFTNAKLVRKDTAVYNFWEIMNAIYDNASKFRPGNPICHLYYVTTGTWREDTTLQARIHSETSLLEDTKLFSTVTFSPIGATEIHRLYRQCKNDITKEFKFEKKESIGDVDGVKEAYLGFITATELLKIVRDERNEIIQGLFYENIRGWQGLKGINNEIQQTLSSPEKNRFVIMNNGVTIIARSLQVTGDRFTISGFYVVNGCQTCNVLHLNNDQLDDTVRVPLRVISTQDQTVIESVIRATNRQTEVKEDQFFAMMPFAKSLEDYFKSFQDDRRLYYERRSNQYDIESIEKQRIVPHQNLVRAVGAMFLGDAHYTTKNFRALRENVGVRMFKESDRLEPYYVAAVALYRLERLFRTKINARYKAARYQILLALRLRLDSDPLPEMSSREMGKRCDIMAATLWQDDSDAMFLEAADDVDQVAGPQWDRDSVRLEKVTAGIFDKFGMKYHVKRHE